MENFQANRQIGSGKNTNDKTILMRLLKHLQSFILNLSKANEMKFCQSYYRQKILSSKHNFNKKN